MREELGADRHGIRGVGVGLDGEEFGYEKLATSARAKPAERRQSKPRGTWVVFTPEAEAEASCTLIVGVDLSEMSAASDTCASSACATTSEDVRVSPME